MMFGWCWRSDQYELYQVYQVSDTKTDEGTLQLDIKHLFPNIWYRDPVQLQLYSPDIHSTDLITCMRLNQAIIQSGLMLPFMTEGSEYI